MYKSDCPLYFGLLLRISCSSGAAGAAHAPLVACKGMQSGTSHLILDRPDVWLCWRRYVYHTLKNSVNTVPTISQADAVYVYDYCYMMWALGDHHAAGHWWLRDNYIPDRRAGQYLLSAYRCAGQIPTLLSVMAEPAAL